MEKAKTNNEIWDSNNSIDVPMPDAIRKFLFDIQDVYKKHNMSLSHQDNHGAFEIEEYKEENVQWLFNANMNIKDVKEEIIKPNF